MMETMAKIPDSTQTSLRQKLLARAAERWPQIQALHTRYRAGFAYIDATLTDGDEVKLCRLRYAGSASQWGFAIYRASHDDYKPPCQTDGPQALPQKPSTPPAASISATPPPGSPTPDELTEMPTSSS